MISGQHQEYEFTSKITGFLRRHSTFSKMKTMEGLTEGDLELSALTLLLRSFKGDACSKHSVQLHEHPHSWDTFSTIKHQGTMLTLSETWQRSQERSNEKSLQSYRMLYRWSRGRPNTHVKPVIVGTWSKYQYQRTSHTKETNATKVLLAKHRKNGT